MNAIELPEYQGCEAENQPAVLAPHKQRQDHGGRDCDAAGSQKITQTVLNDQM